MLKRLTVVLAVALIGAAPARAAVPTVDARAFYVVDATTGEVLAQKNADVRMPIASITKLMTVLVTLERSPRLSQRVRVARDAAAVGESTINLRAGDRLSVQDLLEGALIQSANDAADALADQFGPGRRAFVARMNAKAHVLGLHNTRFTRPDGLDAPGHVSSARDVTTLARVVMRNSAVRAIVRRRTATIAGGRRLFTWNDLLGQFRGLVGVKTGHTGTAGWCQVAEVRRDGLDVYATILGSPTRGQRNADLASLLRWAVGIERPTWVVAPGRVYARAPVGYGRAGVDLVAAKPLLRPVRTDLPLTERVIAPASLPLPVKRGERFGNVLVYSGRRLIGRRPLVAARSVGEPGIGTKLVFYTRRTFAHLGGWFG